ncbi:hypothetical protein LCGC14_0799200 [marine sediment metagenome]|uniref:Uncharacterized protein n=1 Tax=marine sediment metagenome TaxID=412755 RepID=A0A0F9QA20_9ZZZZ
MAVEQHFYSNLQGRRITPLPARTEPHFHMREDLPQGIVYLVHTVYVDNESGEPTLVSERVDVTSAFRDDELNKDAPAAIGDTGTISERFKNAPQSATIPITFLGSIWELLP